jgi:hypothetical protein
MGSAPMANAPMAKEPAAMAPTAAAEKLEFVSLCHDLLGGKYSGLPK